MLPAKPANPEKGSKALDVLLSWPQKLVERIRGSRSETTSILTQLEHVQKPSGPYRTPAEVQKPAEYLRLEEGYAEALETQKLYQLLKTREKAPDFGQVLKTFTPEMLAAAQNFQHPWLILITKGRSFNDLIAATNDHKTMPDQNDVHVDEMYKKHASKKPEQWGAHIIEAPTNVDVQDFDDVILTLGERLKRFTQYKKSAKVGGMDRFKCAHLMMQALKEGRPIDDKSWTMLDEDSTLSESRVPGADWSPYARRVRFGWSHPGDRNGRDKFRRSVGGDVPNA